MAFHSLEQVEDYGGGGWNDNEDEQESPVKPAGSAAYLKRAKHDGDGDDEPTSTGGPRAVRRGRGGSPFELRAGSAFEGGNRSRSTTGAGTSLLSDVDSTASDAGGLGANASSRHAEADEALRSLSFRRIDSRFTRPPAQFRASDSKASMQAGGDDELQRAMRSAPGKPGAQGRTMNERARKRSHDRGSESLRASEQRRKSAEQGSSSMDARVSKILADVTALSQWDAEVANQRAGLLREPRATTNTIRSVISRRGGEGIKARQAVDWGGGEATKKLVASTVRSKQVASYAELTRAVPTDELARAVSTVFGVYDPGGVGAVNLAHVRGMVRYMKLPLDTATSTRLAAWERAHQFKNEDKDEPTVGLSDFMAALMYVYGDRLAAGGDLHDEHISAEASARAESRSADVRESLSRGTASAGGLGSTDGLGSGRLSGPPSRGGLAASSSAPVLPSATSASALLGDSHASRGSMKATGRQTTATMADVVLGASEKAARAAMPVARRRRLEEEEAAAKEARAMANQDTPLSPTKVAARQYAMGRQTDPYATLQDASRAVRRVVRADGVPHDPVEEVTAMTGPADEMAKLVRHQGNLLRRWREEYSAPEPTHSRLHRTALQSAMVASEVYPQRFPTVDEKHASLQRKVAAERRRRRRLRTVRSRSEQIGSHMAFVARQTSRSEARHERAAEMKSRINKVDYRREAFDTDQARMRARAAVELERKVDSVMRSKAVLQEQLAETVAMREAEAQRTRQHRPLLQRALPLSPSPLPARRLDRKRKAAEAARIALMDELNDVRRRIEESRKAGRRLSKLLDEEDLLIDKLNDAARNAPMFPAPEEYDVASLRGRRKYMTDDGSDGIGIFRASGLVTTAQQGGSVATAHGDADGAAVDSMHTSPHPRMGATVLSDGTRTPAHVVQVGGSAFDADDAAQAVYGPDGSPLDGGGRPGSRFSRDHSDGVAPDAESGAVDPARVPGSADAAAAGSALDVDLPQVALSPSAQQPSPSREGGPISGDSTLSPTNAAPPEDARVALLSRGSTRRRPDSKASTRPSSRGTAAAESADSINGEWGAGRSPTQDVTSSPQQAGAGDMGRQHVSAPGESGAYGDDLGPIPLLPGDAEFVQPAVHPLAHGAVAPSRRASVSPEGSKAQEEWRKAHLIQALGVAPIQPRPSGLVEPVDPAYWRGYAKRGIRFQESGKVDFRMATRRPRRTAPSPGRNAPRVREFGSRARLQVAGADVVATGASGVGSTLSATPGPFVFVDVRGEDGGPDVVGMGVVTPTPACSRCAARLYPGFTGELTDSMLGQSTAGGLYEGDDDVDHHHHHAHDHDHHHADHARFAAGGTHRIDGAHGEASTGPGALRSPEAAPPIKVARAQVTSAGKPLGLVARHGTASSGGSGGGFGRYQPEEVAGSDRGGTGGVAASSPTSVAGGPTRGSSSSPLSRRPARAGSAPHGGRRGVSGQQRASSPSSALPPGSARSIATDDEEFDEAAGHDDAAGAPPAPVYGVALRDDRASPGIATGSGAVSPNVHSNWADSTAPPESTPALSAVGEALQAEPSATISGKVAVPHPPSPLLGSRRTGSAAGSAVLSERGTHVSRGSMAPRAAQSRRPSEGGSPVPPTVGSAVGANVNTVTVRADTAVPRGADVQPWGQSTPGGTPHASVH